MLRSFSAFFFAFLALSKVGEGIKLDEWFGLRLPSDARDLQGPTVFNLCAKAFTGPNNHLLAELDPRGRVLAKWVPILDENFNAVVDLTAGTFTLNGAVIPKGQTNQNNLLNISVTFSKPVTFTSCYCASSQFLGGGAIDYNKIQTQCTLTNFLSRPATNANQLFCPFCENNQCQIASQTPGAPSPVYRDWIFFTQVTGSLFGPGIGLFYQLIQNHFDVTGTFTTCSPDITNVPLPQLGCSNFASPEDGSGFGVNGKNQKCGFSTWFNCAEILAQLGGNNVSVHIADINLDLFTCPLPLSPSPTPPIIIPPTTSPTTTPTVSPSASPTVPPSKAPTTTPTTTPTASPSVTPTHAPTTSPTVSPTHSPTTSPTPSPSTTPTVTPTFSPTPCPTPVPCKNITVCVPLDVLNETWWN